MLSKKSMSAYQTRRMGRMREAVHVQGEGECAVEQGV